MHHFRDSHRGLGLVFLINVSDYRQELAEKNKQRVALGHVPLDEQIRPYAYRGMFLPVVGALLLLDGLRRIGSRRIFDGKRRAVISETFVNSRAWTRDRFQKVVLGAVEDPKGQRELLQAALVQKGGKAVSLAAIATGDPLVMDIVAAGWEISRLLDLPLVVQGMPQRGSEELQSHLLAISRQPVAKAA